MEKCKSIEHPRLVASNQFFVPHNVFEETRFLNQKPSTRLLYCVLCKLKNRLEIRMVGFIEALMI